MKIGIISDTHGVFGREFKEFLECTDEIWHCGDFGGGADFIKEISGFKPLVGVHGNIDGRETRQLYPAFKLIEREKRRILMTHIGGSPGRYDLKAKALIENLRPDIFVCGHSHILKIVNDTHYNMLVINPGACGTEGWQIFRTALRFELNDGKIENMEVFKLPK